MIDLRKKEKKTEPPPHRISKELARDMRMGNCDLRAKINNAKQVFETPIADWTIQYSLTTNQTSTPSSSFSSSTSWLLETRVRALVNKLSLDTGSGRTSKLECPESCIETLDKKCATSKLT